MRSCFTILAFAVLLGCEEQNSTTGYRLIPDVRISREINIRQPAYSDLSQPGGYVYLPNEGYRGILVLQSYQQEYYAFDRACPTAPDEDCGELTVHRSRLFIGCGQYQDSTWEPCTPNQYNLDGSIKSGPSDQRPKSYQIRKDGSTLRINNRGP